VYKSFLLSILITALLPVVCFAQRRGFIDDFEDGSFEFMITNTRRPRPPVTIWETITPGTYGLSEQNGVLRIDYSRTSGIGAFDRFTFTPPREINVSDNPSIRISVKSSVATVLTIQPTYSMRPPTYEYLDKEIPGDNTWQPTHLIYHALYIHGIMYRHSTSILTGVPLKLHQDPLKWIT